MITETSLEATSLVTNRGLPRELFGTYLSPDSVVTDMSTGKGIKIINIDRGYRTFTPLQSDDGTLGSLLHTVHLTGNWQPVFVIGLRSFTVIRPKNQQPYELRPMVLPSAAWRHHGDRHDAAGKRVV